MSPASVTMKHTLDADAECLRACADRLQMLSEVVGPSYADSLKVAAGNARVSAKIVEITVRLMEREQSSEGKSLDRLAA